MPPSDYISLRAVIWGLVSILALLALHMGLTILGIYGTDFSSGDATVVVAAGILMYVCGGYLAGVLAGRHQVLNASIVGLLFGLLTWLGFKLSALAGVSWEEFPLSPESAAMGAGIIAVLGCGVGGILSILLPYRGRRV